MAKLYWRVKRDGKWTWTPAEVLDTIYHIDENGKQRSEVYVHQIEDEDK